MDTVQLYPILTEVGKQTLGEDDLNVIDTNSFVSLGVKVLSSQAYTTNFLNTLVLRIARTIVSFRMYNSVLKPLVFGDIRWGALVQKIKSRMPKAMEDKAYDLVDGKSVDMYIVMKPDVTQKFFGNRTPYSFGVTIQTWQLRRAFISEGDMSAFIDSIFGEVQNALEQGFENLGYLTMDNFIANVGEGQKVHLLTEYKTLGKGTTLTSDNSIFDNEYLRFCIRSMNLTARRMASMRSDFNTEGETRHTPFEYQRFVTIADFYESMRTVVQWEAFHTEYVEKTANIVIPQWQNAKNPFDIKVTNSDGTETEVNNILAFIHDRDALGVYRKEQEVLTTPVNARGRYVNTFWHEEQMWFNDMSENGVVFLND